jgi:hypothetical protein
VCEVIEIVLGGSLGDSNGALERCLLGNYLERGVEIILDVGPKMQPTFHPECADNVGKKRFGIFFKQHRVKVNSVLLQKRRASIFP